MLAKRIVWLLLLAIPLQGVSAVTVALQGPAHYHRASEKTSQSRAHHTHAFSHVGHGSHSHHGEREVRRHYHLPGERAVLVREHRHDGSAAVAERTPTVESVSAAFIALIPAMLGAHTPDLESGIEIGPAKRLQSCIPRRIERPPRLLQA